MLNEEVKRYRELSGDNNPHTPISRIGGYLDGYEKAMEQKTGWIPCSERLPESEGDYLVTFKLSFMNFIEVCTFNKADWDKGGYDEVIAWMPLPKPYIEREVET